MKPLLLATILLTAGAAQAQTPQDLLQQALRLERSNGDLPGAIELYQQIATSQSGDRSTEAQALLNLGRAYEALGSQEATSAYQRLIEGYSEFGELVSEARVRLETMTPKPANNLNDFGLAPELIHEDIGYATASFSADGRLFASTNWTTNALGYQVVGSPQVTYITEQFDSPARTGSSGSSARFSPDNNEIAFLWWNGEEKTHWLRVHDRSSGDTRVLFRNEDRFGIEPGAGYAYMQVYDWTSDGQAVMIQTWLGPIKGRVELIDVRDGRPVKSANLDGTVACLAEDRFALATAKIDQIDVAVSLDLDTGAVTRLVPMATESRVITCSGPAGLAVIESDLTGDVEQVAYEVSGGLLGDRFASVRDVFADAKGVALTTAGEMFFYRQPGGGSTRRLEVISYDPGTWRMAGLEARLEVSGATPIGWAKESEDLAWIPTEARLAIRSSSGDVRQVDLTGSYRTGPAGWSIAELTADGSALLLFNDQTAEKDRTLLVSTQDGSILDSLEAAQASPGLRGQEYVRAQRSDAETVCLERYDASTGRMVEQVCYPDRRSNTTWYQLAPDGKRALVYSQGENGRHYYLLSIQNGELERILEDGGHNPFWLPGGEHYFYVTNDRRHHVASVDGAESPSFLPRFQETRMILEMTAHPNRPALLIHSVRKPAEQGDTSKLYRVGDLRDLVGIN